MLQIWMMNQMILMASQLTACRLGSLTVSPGTSAAVHHCCDEQQDDDAQKGLRQAESTPNGCGCRISCGKSM